MTDEQTSAEISAREQAFNDEVRRNFRWNFTVNMLYGLFGTTGWRLIMAPTFVPSYMYQLGGSNMLVGLLLFVGGISRFFTPPLTAPLIEHQPRIKRKAVMIGGLIRWPVLCMALAGFFLPPRLNLISFFVFYSLFNMFMGMQNVVYNTVMAKIIPVDMRGRFIGLREFAGGVTASLVALAAGMLIKKLAFPHSFAATYLLAFALTSVGLVFFAFSREPAAPVVLAKTPLLERLRMIPALLKADTNFAMYCVCRAIGSFALMSNPFFILYAGNKMTITGKELGQLTFCYFIAQTSINLFFGRVADRSGFRRVFLISVVIWTLALATIVFSPASYRLAVVVFLALGAGVGGFNMSMGNMVLEFGDTAGMPMRLALVNSIGEISSAFGPLIAGFLADNVSYKAVFSLSIFFTLLAFTVMYTRVTEPRKRYRRT